MGKKEKFFVYLFLSSKFVMLMYTTTTINRCLTYPHTHICERVMWKINHMVLQKFIFNSINFVSEALLEGITILYQALSINHLPAPLCKTIFTPSRQITPAQSWAKISSPSCRMLYRRIGKYFTALFFAILDFNAINHLAFDNPEMCTTFQ